MDALIVGVFVFGFSIFYALSLIELKAWPLIFRNRGELVTDDNVRFIHASLKRLTPLLPPSNGLVILVGTTLLFMQATGESWSLAATALPVFYLSMMIGIIVIGKNPAVVFSIRSHDSSSDIADLRIDLRLVGIHHHIALFTNLTVVIAELAIFTF